MAAPPQRIGDPLGMGLRVGQAEPLLRQAGDPRLHLAVRQHEQALRAGEAVDDLLAHPAEPFVTEFIHAQRAQRRLAVA